MTNIVRKHTEDGIKRVAIYSPERWYRYLLSIGEGEKQVTFVLLNPSTATEQKDDNTVRRCLGYAKEWGYDRIEVVNLFAWRATIPAELRTVRDPVGLKNRTFIHASCARADLVVVGWGAYPIVEPEHYAAVLGYAPHALDVTKNGMPRHPLYLKKDLKPKTWSPPT